MAVYLSEHEGQIQGTKEFRVSLDDEWKGMNWTLKFGVIWQTESHCVVGKYRRVTVEEFEGVVGVTHKLDEAIRLAYVKAYSEARGYAVLSSEIKDSTALAKRNNLVGKVGG